MPESEITDIGRNKTGNTGGQTWSRGGVKTEPHSELGSYGHRQTVVRVKGEWMEGGERACSPFPPKFRSALHGQLAPNSPFR